jgi:UDP-N-acetylmuramoyl-L-alanyl-D-glutamate--2,6-diaminopimelate ligase
MIKKLLKKILPRQIFVGYHWLLAWLGALIYRFPSNKLIVVVVTGTNGKSTTVNLIAKVLESTGHKVGLTSTANFKIGDKEWLNDKKMTMLGRFGLQKILRKMVKASCRYAVVEVSSEGIKQFRHLGLNYDYVVFTNLTPEHLESHGGFANYRLAKEKLFAQLIKLKGKTIANRKISKQIIANLDDKHVGDFIKYGADKKWGYGILGQTEFSEDRVDAKLVAEDFGDDVSKTIFKVQDQTIGLKILGRFNIYNALPAIIIGQEEGLTLDDIRQALEKFGGMPGRMEFIYAKQDFKILVDYAPEPVALEQMYQAIAKLDRIRTIHVLGSCGGGRDKARRPIMGHIAGQRANIVIVTNEDPYNDDPQEIVDQVAAGAIEVGKKLGENLFKILDRRQAINMALEIAEKNDLVIVTGKGSEQYIMGANGSKTSWDDREVIREILKAKN